MNQSETKGTLTEIKNTKRGVNRRLKDAERAHNLKGRLVELPNWESKRTDSNVFYK